MPKDAWTAAVCASAREYEAETELRRLGITCYVPQYRKKWLPPGAHKPVFRRHPLFRGYLLVPACEGRSRLMHYARHLQKPRFLLSSAEGTLWTIPGEVVFEVARIENEGGYDECDPDLGDKVRLRSKGAMGGVDLFVASVDSKIAQLLTPLFGGVRATAKIADLARAG
jgi:hypothetical protein